MKTLVKFVNLHDGDSIEMHNGNRICIETYPRLEAIIAAFYDDGWELINRTAPFTPAIQEGGSYSFYRGGWDCLFMKRVEDDAVDNGNEILERVLRSIL